ncbi:environmental stress-induced protein Ves [Sporomusaceae bacterium BoRhaA]|uniref:HutD/Ves family protein n=1 Tax=Pelorhabdus rhamnosifermentans TaxID=2772457 RepID=UPI001C06349E|nr:HutD family protein [Pelorhabdus rhamnosifermentans]MBU2699400.1 environmental stress-induced protein Ves [Pelorhabdus rhamnosifermentans]
MPYSIEVVRSTEQYTTNWSGGTTTQIAIYPRQADYGQRTFIWRLSSAKVELEHSTFTSLPGISRILMVLDGQIRLVHVGHHHAELKSFEQDSFSGDWCTQSFGKVRDFNLMMASNCKGRLTALTVEAKVSIQSFGDIYSERHQHASVFYCVDSNIQCVFNEKYIYKLQAGDALILHSEQSSDKLNLKLSNGQSELAHVIQVDLQY